MSGTTATLVAFQPNQNTSPPFQQVVTLDGAQYNLICAWSIWRGGYLFSIVDQSGTVVYTGPLVGSPSASAVYLAPGIFTTSTILYRSDTGNFEIVP